VHLPAKEAEILGRRTTAPQPPPEIFDRNLGALISTGMTPMFRSRFATASDDAPVRRPFMASPLADLPL
jgi:hypothetical protein